jgi:hypothetical protein
VVEDGFRSDTEELCWTYVEAAEGNRKLVVCCGVLLSAKSEDRVKFTYPRVYRYEVCVEGVGVDVVEATEAVDDEQN